MFQRFSLMLILLTATSCVSQTSGNTELQSLGARNVVEIHAKDKVLKSWWSFFNDPVLDRFIAASINLNVKNPEGESQEGQGMPNIRANLIHEVTQSYIDYRYIQTQKNLLKNFIRDKQSFISDLENDYELNETDKLRFNQLKNGMKASYKKFGNFDGQMKAIITTLTARTKLLPEYVAEVLDENISMPPSDIKPILASPVSVIAEAPEVVEARAMFTRSISKNVDFSDTASVFPDVTVNRFFGISDDVFLNDETLWNVSSGAGVKSLKMEKYNSLYSEEAFTVFRNDLNQAVTKIESMVVSYAHIQEQYVTLRNSVRVKENETPPLMSDVYDTLSSRLALLEAHDALYRSRLASLRAEYEKMKVLLQLYKLLGAS